MEPRTVITMISLAAAAVGSWAVYQQVSTRPAPAADTAPATFGYYAEDARLIRTDDGGQVVYEISARRIDQQSDGGAVDLQQVTIDYAPAASRPWQLRADTGRIPPGSKVVALTGGVIAETRGSTALPATIRTEYLEFDTRNDVASTRSEVSIDYDGSTVQAIGMRADLLANRFELLSQVSGRYAP